MLTEQAENRPPIDPARRNHPPLSMLLGVSMAAIILIGGSLLWFWRDNTHNHSGTVAIVTPTATATSTPTWTPTEITPPMEALFYETFANNNHGWSLTSEGGYFRILVDHMLILSNNNPDSTLVESVPASTDLSNYVINVDFTINRDDPDDSMGLYLRGDSTLDHDYRVDINGDNTIDIVKEWLDTSRNPQTTVLFSPHLDTDLKRPGNANTLSVTMLGPTIIVSVNDLVLAMISDSSYTSGQVAFFAHNGVSSSGMVVSLSQVEIDRIASPLQTPGPTPTVTPHSG